MSPVTRTGDEMVRTALYEAANVLLSRITRFSKLKRWGMDVAKRRGSKRAKVALARKVGWRGAIMLNTIEADATLETCRALINQINAGLSAETPLVNVSSATELLL